MSLLRELVAAVRALPGAIAGGINGYARQLHRPVLDALGREPICPTCRKPWPCDTFIRLTERRRPRTHGSRPPSLLGRWAGGIPGEGQANQPGSTNRADVR